MSILGASWRTTTMAILSLIGLISGAASLIIDGDPATNPDWGVLIPLILAQLGLLFARDNKVSSETAGAK